GAKDAKRRKRLEDELEWVRSSPRARQTKSRARLDRYEEMAAEADRNRKLDFEEIQIPPGPRLGSVVVEVGNLVKGFGDRCLFENLSFSLPRNGIVGVLGPNGVGKTTLFKMIVARKSRTRAPSGSARRSRSPTSTSPVSASIRRRTCGRSSPTARRTSAWATSRSRAARTWPRSGSRARTSRSRPRSCPAASATG